MREELEWCSEQAQPMEWPLLTPSRAESCGSRVQIDATMKDWGAHCQKTRTGVKYCTLRSSSLRGG